uniref:Glucosyltransferase 3 n=1 Tax=Nemophila menziesii TaxID=79376 RepID=A0A3B1F024_NEMME|nr:glucosyltransferase 3 [Nemophila menziesii]
MPSILSNSAHILLFPFPTSGHIIPILDLANQLLARGLTITILITPANLTLLSTQLIELDRLGSLHTLVLPFPNPPNPSETSLAARVHASSQLSNTIIQWFQSHTSPPVAIVSDFFLGWTNSLASQLGIPRLVFWPSGVQRSSLVDYIWQNDQLSDSDHQIQDNSVISFPDVPNSPAYPKWQACGLSTQYKKGDPSWEFFKNGVLANTQSWGAIYNSFRDLEGVYIDYIKKKMGHGRVWAVGPLLPANDASKRGGSCVMPIDDVMTWLDTKTNSDNSVVYVCFGSRVELTTEQLDSLAAALEISGVHFILCVKLHQEISKEYEDRVAGRGLIIRGWAPQVAILRHRAVGAFLTHCGWNSILEGIAAGVVMLTWPMGADQFTNANLLVDELKVAMKACEGGDSNVPNPAMLANVLAESINGGRAERERVTELCDAALKAVQSGNGSSAKDLDSLTNQLNGLKVKIN